MTDFVIEGAYITLGQLLKAAGLVENGAEAKLRIQSGEARVNGETEIRRGRKLLEGDKVIFDGTEIRLVR